MLTAGPDAAGWRIDQWLAAELAPDLSRARIQALIKAGAVTLDGKPATGPKTKLAGGETIRILSARMNADPAIGLIQTMPMLVGGQTIFARVTQFAGRIYGPPIARGVAAGAAIASQDHPYLMGEQPCYTVEGVPYFTPPGDPC